jgi:hypothetical protein
MDEAQFVDVDPWAPQENAAPAVVAKAGPTGVKEHVLKMASLIKAMNQN